MSFSLVVFMVVNLGIFLGYMSIARFVVPNLNIQYRTTKYGGAAFFALCAATHIELAVHAWTKTPLTVEDFTSWHMLAIHIPQFIAVWVFTYGLFREVRVAGTGRLQLSRTYNILRNTVSEIEGMKGRVLDDDARLLDEALTAIRTVQSHISGAKAHRRSD